MCDAEAYVASAFATLTYCTRGEQFKTVNATHISRTHLPVHTRQCMTGQSGHAIAKNLYASVKRTTLDLERGG